MESQYHYAMTVAFYTKACILLQSLSGFAEDTHFTLSVRNVSVEPILMKPAFMRFQQYNLKSLILAQNERWRRG